MSLLSDLPDTLMPIPIPIPTSIILSLSILTALTAFYFLTAPFFSTDKQRAYILSTLSSSTMTLLSLPFLYLYLTKGLAHTYEACQVGFMGWLGWFGVIFFGTYLFADLTIGYLMYPSQVGLLTGWIHHIVYIGLMIHLHLTRLTPTFMIPTIMELPTFDLAISHLFPAVRNDARFLSLMFLTRILFHAIYLAHAALPSSIAVVDGSYVPTVMLTLALVLHVGWFKGGLQGYLKRRRVLLKREEKAGKLLGSRNETQNQEEIPSLESEIDLHQPRIRVSTPEATTPEDSPILTPYTPSQTPLTIRDAYFFPIQMPNLPQMSMTMPNLPTMSIPPLPNMPSFSDLASALPKGMNMKNIHMNMNMNMNMKMNPDIGGFRDAVKGRWEAERGRFAAGIGMRGGRPMGIGMGLGLGGLRLRRKKSGGGGGEEEGEVEDGTTKVEVQVVGDDH